MLNVAVMPSDRPQGKKELHVLWNGQTPTCIQHRGLWLSEQSPGTHTRLGCGQLKSVLLQTATAC